MFILLRVIWVLSVADLERMPHVLFGEHRGTVVAHGGCDYLSVLTCVVLMYNMVDPTIGAERMTHVDSARDQLSCEWRATPAKWKTFLYIYMALMLYLKYI